jgi:hypothetical protein
MKKLLFSIALFSLTHALFGNKIMFASKDQTVWFEVELIKNDLLVRSNKFRKQQVFYSIKKNVYENKLGAIIKVLDDEKIQYDDPNHRLKFNLYRDKLHETILPEFNINRLSLTLVNTQQLEGTWYNKELRKKLAILSTRDGFKIKFSGSVDWVEFAYDRVNDKFIDSKGNHYSFQSLSNAEWISFDGKNKVKIEKISDTVDY